MKTINIKPGAVCTLFAFFTMNLFAQTTTTNTTNTTKTTTTTITESTKENKKEQAKLDKNKVPKAVTDHYVKEYPVTTYETWYGYPVFDKSSYWYDYDPYLYTGEYGKDYVVEFTQNGTPYAVVYSESGEKIATHKKEISDLPQAVYTAINKGPYKTWKLGSDKEEIFRDMNLDKLKVYRVKVSQGDKKHTLYFQADGTLLKDKKVS